MPRRAQKGINKILIATSAVAIIGIGFSLFIILDQSKNSLRSVRPLNVTDYIKEGTTLSGTVGTITGTVTEKLRWTSNRGEIVSVTVDQGQELPIMIPPQFKNINIARGDKFTFKVEVGDEQILITRELMRR